MKSFSEFNQQNEYSKSKFCRFRTRNMGACGKLIKDTEDFCSNHVGKKEVIKNPAKKFRGKSKKWDGFQNAVE